MLGEISKQSQSVGSARDGTRGRVQALDGVASVSSPFAAPALQGSAARRMAIVNVARLLTVKEAAAGLHGHRVRALQEREARARAGGELASDP